MRIIFSIFAFLLFSLNFGQTKDRGSTVNFRDEIANMKPIFSVQKQINSVNNFSNTNLAITQSLNQIYARNNGFKEEINFKSDENTIQTPFGKMKYKETKRDRIADVLNIIFNK